MATLYKLTDSHGCTQNNTQWGENVTHRAKGSREQGLCSDGWIHAYIDPLLAALLNPIHANFKRPLLWEAKGRIGARDNGLKVGCRSLTTIKKVSLPQISVTKRIAFGIFCAQEVYQDIAWEKWAEKWLSGADRSSKAADTAAYAAARATADAADAAADAADAAADAAYAAAAYAADAAYAAYAAVRAAARAAADAAADAADAAAYAAARAAKPLNLIALAHKALTIS